MAHGSCLAAAVSRILLVMRGALTEQTVRDCCGEACTDGALIALCYELPQGHDSFIDGLAAQRRLTAILRQIHGARAETIAVFVVSSHDGQRVEDCARDWGATEVRA